MFLYDKNSQFNLANMFTFVNITCGILAIYFLTHQNFLFAATLAWIGGAFDIFDGKIARKYNLSTEFGIQLDSYADFVSFVIVPVFFIYYGVVEPGIDTTSIFDMSLVAIVSVYYIISGLRRLISFNLHSNEGEVAKYFTGIPTPLGAILLWLVYLSFYFGFFDSYHIAISLMFVIGVLLNSRVKIPHP